MSSMAKSLPVPPVSLLMKITLNALTLKDNVDEVNWCQFPSAVMELVVMVANKLSLRSLNSTLILGLNRVAIPGASVLSKFITQKH